MCGGDFMSKNPEEAMDFLSYVAEVSRGWDEPNAREVGRMNSQPNASNAKAEKYTLNEGTDTKAKFATMARRLEELEVQAISDTPMQAKPCSICQYFEHMVEECLTMPAEPSKFLLEAKGTSVHTTWPSTPVDNLQYQISRLTNLNTVQEKGKFPSQPHQNPKGIHEVELRRRIFSDEGNQKQERQKEESKGKKKESSTKKEDLEAKVNEKPERTINQEEMIKKHMPPPLPQALHGKRGINNASEILEVLRQVKVNIPLLDTIKQVLTYAKFLKDLCAIKRGLNVSKKAFLTKEVSSIIQCKSPMKYKDLGCLTISVMIGEDVCGESFVGLGSKCELLTYSVYKFACYSAFFKDEERNSPFNSTRRKHKEVIKEEPPKLILKPITHEVKYAYLEENKQSPVVISSSFTTTQEDCPLEILKRCKKAIEWKISDLKGIIPLVCTHHIYMEEEAKPVRQPSEGHPFYCLLDGYSEYFQIEIAVEDQEKTTFTCPFRTYAYRRMPFGLCNAPTTFQRCMLTIFSDMVERIMEVFMDDITVYGSPFDECLVNLEAMLNQCIEKDLVLNWEKCHFHGTPRDRPWAYYLQQGIEWTKQKLN
ncbi:Retrovirus-related Pol polyprotein from transposon 17.6 [Vitis vinifera]|uniref:Retrovirus-related Pol polyprotein from transposon 17.6 n=1 Tax=Vitis vinifera TaxID=29760 RepID=A0A438FVQ9_VITVI|nr:Retrovirus-related Pol polyprotein from transposon 17.6 [Vitis vinifera]